ncbi:MAG: hypothetical protein ACT4P7_09200 [Gemmatimonadaceae bacterium]
MIRFLDGHGFAWHVTELSPRNLADVSGCLYFFSRGSTLRLTSYPADWEDLGWPELEALRARADVLSRDVTRPAESSGRWSRSTEALA